ncbi:hypothetical protein G6F57_019341 [Rhizopus arrhizus]|nr:hypothetical protein G6F57_019341 [Rhizopus arrhizus]
MRPGRGENTITTSPRNTASAMPWVTNSTVLRVSIQIRCNSTFIWSRVSASRAPNGSSISTTPGAIASARAMPTRCFMPPEISRGSLFCAGRKPTSSSAARVRSDNCGRFSLPPKPRSTARYTFWKQGSQGSSEWFWNTTARSGPGPVISRSAHSSTPLVGRVSPALRFSNVDLPQPEWPISVMNSPCSTVRSMSRSATKAPLRVVNV